MAKCHKCGAKTKFLINICEACSQDERRGTESLEKQEVNTNDGAHADGISSKENTSVINRIDTESKYGTARGFSSFLEILGWLVVVAGGIAAISMQSMAGLLAGAGLAITGFMLIMGAQVTKAVVDTADHTREIHILLKGRSN